MPEKKTIRDITIEHRQRPGARSATSSRNTRESQVQSTRSSQAMSPRKSGKHGIARRRERRTMWAIVSLIALVLGIFFLSIFGKSTVRIVPEQASADVSVNLTAYRDAGNDQLRFELMSIADEIRETVEATGEETVERRASGEIVIFNETNTAQNLREETRFETPEGLIFKTAKGAGITIPGAKNGVPGQLEVTVYAAEAGEEYNVGLTDFVIPGWREISDPRFETQYARSKTEMTGGFVGVEKTVDQAEKVRVEGLLGETLEQRLTISAEAQKTQDFVFFEDGLFVTLSETTQEAGEDNSVELVQSGSLTALLFNKQELSEIIAKQVLTSYDDEPIIITNFEELDFKLMVNEPLVLDQIQTIPFALQGTPHFEWLIEEDSLKEQLAGVHKRAFSDVLRNVSGVKRAELSITPFWKTKLPDDPEKITIDVLDSKI